MISKLGRSARFLPNLCVATLGRSHAFPFPISTKELPSPELVVKRFFSVGHGLLALTLCPTAPPSFVPKWRRHKGNFAEYSA